MAVEVTEPGREVLTEDVWRAYEAAQKHYDADHTLFTNRMNLFLVVESALLAVATNSVWRSSPGVSVQLQVGVTIFGVVLSAAWLAVAISSYRWVKVWRRHLITLGEVWEAKTGVVPSSAIFSKARRDDEVNSATGSSLVFADGFAWTVRPTLIICALPIVYASGWIALILIH